MRAKNQKIKSNKSLGKNQISKTITTNKTTSLKLKNNNKNKAKSKSKETKQIKNIIRPKSKPKKLNKTFNSNLEYNINNNNINNYNNTDNNNYQYINNDIYNSTSNQDLYNNNINSLKDISINNNTQMKNTISNNENQYNFKKSLDRLLYNSQNILEKQNNILSECDLLTKYAAANDYAIQNLIRDNNSYNNDKIMEKYNSNILKVLSKFKNNNKENEINVELKKENEYLKKQLEIINIETEDKYQIKSNELNNIKIVLVSEINHILNYLNEIGYNNIPIEKMEVVNITSQKITDFFQIIIKVIKQMKELIHNKETIISKMTIEQATNRSNNIDNINNKSYEKLSMDYNNIGFKTYNFSVRNNIQNKTYNISFRNNHKNNKENDIISRTQKSLNINDFQKNKFEINDINNEEQINNEVNNICNNYSSSNIESDRNYQTGNFMFQDILNNNKNK